MFTVYVRCICAPLCVDAIYSYLEGLRPSLAGFFIYSERTRHLQSNTADHRSSYCAELRLPLALRSRTTCTHVVLIKRVVQSRVTTQLDPPPQVRLAAPAYWVYHGVIMPKPVQQGCRPSPRDGWDTHSRDPRRTQGATLGLECIS